MDVFDQKRAQVVNLLFANTKQGQVEWEELDQGRLGVQIGSNSVVLERKAGEIAEYPDYVISLYDLSGNRKEHFSDRDLKDVPTPYADVQGYFTLMEQLFELAMRKLSGADEAIDAVIDVLSRVDSARRS